MLAIKLNLRQLTACYRIPTASGVWLSYPLPPYSTVYGFLRALCEQKEETEDSINYKNTKLSISGKYESSFFDLQRMHKEDFDDKISKTDIFKIQTLYEVELVIHIIADDKRINLINDALKNPPGSLSLGRREDLITEIYFRNIDILNSKVDLDDPKFSNIYFNPSYIPKRVMEKHNFKRENGELDGIIFNLPKDSYFLREYNLRRMVYEKTIFMNSNPILSLRENIDLDDEGYIVWLN